jgi:hypothetical protein
MKKLVILAVMGLVIGGQCEPQAAPAPVSVKINPKGFATSVKKLEAFAVVTKDPTHYELQLMLYMDGEPVAGSTRPVSEKTILEYADFGSIVETGRYQVRATLYRRGKDAFEARSEVLRVNIPGEDGKIDESRGGRGVVDDDPAAR